MQKTAYAKAKIMDSTLDIGSLGHRTEPNGSPSECVRSHGSVHLKDTCHNRKRFTIEYLKRNCTETRLKNWHFIPFKLLEIR